jgi:hypothetical protein
MNQESIIQASEKPIYKILSSDYYFEIPYYQRPYSWGLDQVEELIDDLSHFAFQNDTFDDLKPYFLGSIVLIKQDKNKPAANVVDGQQRLTTITIILSVLRDMLSDFRDSITKLLYEESDPILESDNKFRLEVRPKDRDFFNKYINLVDGISKMPTDGNFSDTQIKFSGNALLMRKKFENIKKIHGEAHLKLFTKYLIQKCYLVVVSTSDQESAYRIFSVLNDRGMQLSHADILKAEIIGKIENKLQEQYSKKWEDLEEQLGVDNFKNLFAHLRMIILKTKPQETILEEVRDYIDSTYVSSEGHKSLTCFIDEELEPYAIAFDDIKNMSFESDSNSEKINQYLKWLNLLDNENWIPPTISFLAKWRAKDSRDRDTQEIVKFLKNLERVAFYLYVNRVNINGRIQRYKPILTSIETNDRFDAQDSSLYLNNDECKSIINALSGDVYGSQFAKYALLRLDDSLSEDGAHYDHPIISIEHVLPQNPKADSDWNTHFPDENERESLTHCLGNLVLLSRRKNAMAQNYDFDKKKMKYFGTKDGVSTFAITTTVLKREKWTPEVIYEIQNERLEQCKEIWQLDIN